MITKERCYYQRPYLIGGIPESRTISPWMSLLLAGQNNGLLMRNSELRPPGLTPLPDTNKAAEKKKVTTSRMIDHTVMAVEGGKDVAMATITHLAVGITMAEAVGINPI